MLYDNQKTISDDILKALGKKELFNIPTGRGKTFILLDVAKRSLALKKKKVIISTSNNALVRSMHDVAVEYGFFDDFDVKIRIGADNYIDKGKLKGYIENGLLFDYINNKEDELLNFLNSNEDLFFDLFDKLVDYKDIANRATLKNLLQSNKKAAHGFSDLTITNHFYLLSKAMYDDNFDIGDYIVLIDEVHEISDVADSILNHSFSVFEFKNMLRNIKKEFKEIEFKGKTSFLKNVQTLYVKSNNCLEKYSNDEKTGFLSEGYAQNKECFESIESILKTKEFTDGCKKAVSLEKENSLIAPYAQYLERVKQYSSKFTSCDKNYGTCGVYYTPSRGYPVLNVSVSNPLGMLNKLFWSKLGLFAGVSATTTSSFSPTQKELRYAYARLGMVQKERSDYDVHYYERLFPKEGIEISLPNEDLAIPQESVYDEDFNPRNSEYYEYIVKFIRATHKNKNSIVLCGGYKEAKYLAGLYISMQDEDVVVDFAKANEKTSITLSNFEKRGGILFAVRNYNTGISLEGELLENLYILNFPNVNFTAKKWQVLKNNSVGTFFVKSESEMLIAFMQTLGRLQRTKDDEGSIFILDSRYNKFSMEKKRKINNIIREYGVLVNDREEIVRKKTIIIEKERKEKLEKLFGF